MKWFGEDEQVQVDELIKQQTVVTRLSILSFEMSIYLVAIESADYNGLIRNAESLPRRFRSVQEVKDAFEDVSVDSAVLIHDSPYDEMIGNPSKAKDQMVLPIDIKAK